ncbi:peptide chain release factor 1, mitochondrial-like [Dorcoceras hygrometricum]|uniref:Peptide chain release factor 1, mitochondrial-like n=1 Tax=Dorcoceras hygrometricum TaxID=472368 RepID=A0A2Z7AGU3_9LAMI|nr:peptide chain release factor 1, mitochondrial-like [Dorcoceras hygrometricum]
MAAASLYMRMSAGLLNEYRLKNSRSSSNYLKIHTSPNFSFGAFRASQEPSGDGKSKFYKELGMFSLRKRIEDSVLRAEMLAPTALEVEEAKRVNQEEVVRDYDLWDDIGKSNEILIKLANSAKVVDELRDIKYKAEEAKLITELAEMDSITYALFKQAYKASLDVKNVMDSYEMSGLLKEPFDMEGACITIESRRGDVYSEHSIQIWAGQLTQMYMKWAQRQGHIARLVEKFPSNKIGVKSASIELEFKFAFGYLSGESGIHSMIRNHETEKKTIHAEATLASVDVIPLFLESSPAMLMDDEDVLISYPSYTEYLSVPSSAIHIRHIPTGLEVESTGERSRFANKIKALDRLKAKLLVLMRNQGSTDVKNITKDAILDVWTQETRRYVFQPNKMVHDLKSGIQVPELQAILNGNIDSLIAANINSRHKRPSCSSSIYR